MRRACILRQLGRCADYTPVPSPSRCGSEAAPWLGPLRRGPAGALHFHRRPFTQSQSQSHTREDAWSITPPKAPSVHPHPHHDAAFDALPPPEQLRSVMRLLAHSVVVCTSAAATPDSPAPVPRGMTMSSFTSLSLRPTPLVTFNVATPSRTLDAVSRSRQFNIHVLSGDVAGARVAEWFRKGNADGLGVFEADKLRDECECEVVAPEASGGATAPLLKGPGVLFALRCSLLGDEPARGLVRARDHVIVLAEVVDIVEGQSGKSESAAFGLAYADRLYRQLGPTMAPAED